MCQTFEDPSPTIDATMRLQPRCSEKTEKESGDTVITTRLLVPSSRVGCLIGKGGSIISEMRNTTRAGIRILAKENLPKVASEDDEMVQVVSYEFLHACICVVLMFPFNLALYSPICLSNLVHVLCVGCLHD